MQITVTQFAKELGLPPTLLIEQLKAAGVSRALSVDTTLTEKDKTQLLDHLRQAHGAKEKQKITLTRRKSGEVGPSRTIQVEVRKKRVLVKRDSVQSDEPTSPQLDTAPPQPLSLDLSHERLKELPDPIFGTTVLQDLKVAHNELAAVPARIQSVHNLRSLDLSHNRITHVAKELGRCASLKELNLASNNLSNAPEALWDLQNLEILNLSGNNISYVPEEIGQLTKLRRLNLAGNNLRDIPASIARLASLESLIVGGNDLTSLPDAIGELSSLVELNVTGNRLTDLPDSLRSLQSLQRLFLHDVPGLDLPPEVLGPSYSEVKRSDSTVRPANPVDILEYFYSSRRGTHPLNEAKMILVGRGGVGKTSLVNRLVFDRSVCVNVT